MNEQRKASGKRQIIIGAVLLAVALIAYFSGNSKSPINFAECVSAGNPIMESYPRQCKAKDGSTFKEDIGNELEKDTLIRIESPRPNAVITSPLTLRGMARGNWFFEASFPIKLLDADGKEVAVIPAKALRDPDGGQASNGAGWMTKDFVPFEATLTFTAPHTKTGTLRLEKDNPSGLPEHDDALLVPVQFK